MITLQKGDVSIQFDHIFRTDYGAVLGINMKQVVWTPSSHLYEVGCQYNSKETNEKGFDFRYKYFSSDVGTSQ